MVVQPSSDPRPRERRGEGCGDRDAVGSPEEIVDTIQQASKAAVIVRAAAAIECAFGTQLTRQSLIDQLSAQTPNSSLQFSIRDAFEMLECAMVIGMQKGEFDF
jgi:hypothetical protein